VIKILDGIALDESKCINIHYFNFRTFSKLIYFTIFELDFCLFIIRDYFDEIQITVDEEDRLRNDDNNGFLPMKEFRRFVE